MFCHLLSTGGGTGATFPRQVVAADTKRTALLEEAKEIEQKLEEGGLKYCPIGKLDAVVEGNFAVGAEVIYPLTIADGSG